MREHDLRTTLTAVVPALVPGALAASVVLDLASVGAPRLFAWSFWLIGVGLVAALSGAMDALGGALAASAGRLQLQGGPRHPRSFRAASVGATIELSITTLLAVELLLRRGALDSGEAPGASTFVALSAVGLALGWLAPSLERLADGRSGATWGGERDHEERHP